MGHRDVLDVFGTFLDECYEVASGYASTVYEASARIGGRMRSNSTYWANGHVSEWCGELIDSDYHLILQLAQRFRLNVTDEIQAQPNGSTDTLWFFNRYYPVIQADDDFSPVYKVLREQIQAAPFPTLYNTYTAIGQMLDRMSLYQWTENYGAGGHSSPMGAYLDSAYVNEYGLDCCAVLTISRLGSIRLDDRLRQGDLELSDVVMPLEWTETNWLGG